jgi:zinc D-Ala-D-Ala carboxypeptidase
VITHLMMRQRSLPLPSNLTGLKDLSSSRVGSKRLWLCLLFFPVFSSAFPMIFDYEGHPIGQNAQYPDTVPDLVHFSGKSNRGHKVTLSLRHTALQELQQLQAQAKTAGIHLSVASGYRSIATQKQMRIRYPQHAELPGYSEHHLGTTVDFTALKADSSAFLWLLQHGFNAGWIPSYYYRFQSKFPPEPWHWRYVGTAAAQEFYTYWQAEITHDLQRLHTHTPQYLTVRTRCAKCLQLRTRPSRDSPSVTTLARGAKVRLLRRQGEWYKVSFSQYRGYVHQSYVVRNED